MGDDRTQGSLLPDTLEETRPRPDSFAPLFQNSRLQNCEVITVEVTEELVALPHS